MRRILLLCGLLLSFPSRAQEWQYNPVPPINPPMTSLPPNMVPPEYYSMRDSVTGDPLVDAMRMPPGVAVPLPSTSLPEVDYVTACGTMPTENQKQICENSESRFKEDLSENWQEVPDNIRINCEGSAKSRGFALYYTSLDLCIVDSVRRSSENGTNPVRQEDSQSHQARQFAPIYPESELEDNKTGFVKTSCRMIRGADGLWRASDCRVISSTGGQDFIDSAMEADARSTWSDDQVVGRINSNGRMDREHSFSLSHD